VPNICPVMFIYVITNENEPYLLLNDDILLDFKIFTGATYFRTVIVVFIH